MNMFLRYFLFIQQHSTKVVIGVLLFTGASLLFIQDNLSINTSTKNMLSEKLMWRQLDREDERLFPQFLNNILVVIDAKTPDQAIDSAVALARELSSDTTYINNVYYPLLLPYFRQSAFLFLAQEELESLADQLARIQPFLGTLLQDKTLRGLFNMLIDAIDAKKAGNDIDIQPLLTEINRALQDDQYSVSWQKLISTEQDSGPPYRQFIIVQTKNDKSDALPVKTVLSHIREAASHYERDGVMIRLTGSLALSYEELRSVSKANITAIIISLSLVGLILMIGLGSSWLVISSLVTLFAGLAITAAFAALTVGELNLISVAFAVLYIGLGIDFAIHLTLRYREEILQHRDTAYALPDALKQVYRPLLLCAISTMIGFYSFMPTAYRGIAELGWIAGSGILISLLLTFTLLPALLNIRHKTLSTQLSASGRTFPAAWFTALPYLYPKQLLLLALVTSVVILAQIDRINFDTNTLNLQDPNNESVQTYRDLLGDSNTSPWHSVLIQKGEQAAADTVDKLKKLPLVADAVWLRNLTPKNQQEKLLVIDDMNLLLGPIDSNQTIKKLSEEDYLSSLSRLFDVLNDYPERALDYELQTLKTHIAALIKQKPGLAGLEKLEHNMLANLDGRIDFLSNAMSASEVTANDLPKDILVRWSNNNDYRIQINPKQNLNNNTAMMQFVQQLQSYNHRVIGAPVIKIEAGKAVVTAFQLAFTYALAAISIMLLIFIPLKLDAVAILFSVLIGTLLTCGFMLLFDIPINFANIIGLPLLLGIGIDSGIHITDRFRREQHDAINIYQTSATRAVITSSMTTICSIGSLAFSSHLGTASMGILLVIGLISMLIATMIILPALLVWFKSFERQDKYA